MNVLNRHVWDVPVKDWIISIVIGVVFGKAVSLALHLNGFFG